MLLVIYRLVYILSLKAINFFTNWSEHAFFEIEHILISAALTAGVTCVANIFSKRNIFKLLVSKLYSTLCKVYLISNNLVICKTIECFINIIYKGNFMPLREQSGIIEEILNDLTELSKGNQAPHLFIISGEAHSGKTILSKKLVNDIFTQKEYIQIFKKHNKSIFYYDFSCFNNQLEEILRNYKYGFYNRYLIIFDNIHKLNDYQIKRLLKAVIREPDKAVCVLMLTRDINYILEGELIAEIDARRKNNTITISRLSGLHFDVEYNFTGGFYDFLKELNINQQLFNNDYIKFHLYYVYHLYLKSKNASIKKMLVQINCRECNQSIMQGFTFICCCALFTGIVDKKIVKEWIKEKKATLNLKTYIDMGILNGFHGIESWEYSMHEKTAQSYITYICEADAGLKLCKEYFRFLYDHTEDEIQYRYSIPFDELYNEKLFDKIVNKGHFQILYDDILFLIKLFNLDKKKYNYELSILNDRAGNFKFTKEKILELYNETKNPKHLILLLHADHMMLYRESFIDEYKTMSESQDTYIKFATNYWISHVKMHQGEWNLEAYIRLCDILPDDLECISNASYEAAHVLRRYYFDCFRIYYLQGNNSFLYFKGLIDKTSKIKAYLNNKLDEYKIYEYKFIYAHYIHYELLFKYYVLNETYITQEELHFVECDNANDLINKATEFYFKSYNYFYENGDKTYHYVLLRLCELAPAFVLSRIENLDESYKPIKEFTEENYRNILGIFDKFRDECGIKENVLEYAAYAETYKLKFTIMCKLMCSDLGVNFDKIINNSAEAGIEYHKDYNHQYPNEYGILRIKILKLLNDYIDVKNKIKFSKELDSLLAICENKNYIREVKLLKTINKMGFEVEGKRLAEVIRFYPIVLQ